MEDPNPQGTDPKDPNSKGGTAGGDPEKTPEGDGIDYKAKFVESQKEAIRLSKKVEELTKSPKPDNQDLPEEEKKLRELLTKIEREKLDTAKADQEKLKSELDQLHTIHGDFDDKKLMNIVERYGVYDEEGNANWTRAMELYERLGGVADYQPKVKQQPKRDKSTEAEPVKDIRKKSMSEIVSEGLKHFGIGG